MNAPPPALFLWLLLQTAVCAEVPVSEQLVTAAGEGQTKVLRQLLAADSESLALEDALAAAVRNGHRDTARILLANGADPNQLSERFGSVPPLAMAVHSGQRELAEDLWRRGAKPQSPCELAALGLDQALLESLEREPSLLEDRRWDDTARQPLLHAAAMHGRLQTIRLLLRRGGSINLADSRGVTALHVASLHGRGNAVRILLENGADIHARTNLRFIAGLHAGAFTPMHFAFAGGHATIMERLVEEGSRLDEPSFSFERMLSVALMRRQRSLVDVLVNHAPESQLHVLLADAVKNDWDLVIESFVRRDVDVTEQLWGAPIHWALAHGDDELAELLIEKGADVNQVYNGGTPLSEAAQRGTIGIMRSLLKKGAPVDKGTVTGTTPLQFAVFAGHRESVVLLLEAGADPRRVHAAARAELAASTGEARLAILALLRHYEAR